VDVRKVQFELGKKLLKIAVRQVRFYQSHVTCIHDFSVLILPPDTKIECDLFNMSMPNSPAKSRILCLTLGVESGARCNQKEPGSRGLLGNAETHRAIASHREGARTRESVYAGFEMGGWDR